MELAGRMVSALEFGVAFWVKVFFKNVFSTHKFLRSQYLSEISLKFSSSTLLDIGAEQYKTKIFRTTRRFLNYLLLSLK